MRIYIEYEVESFHGIKHRHCAWFYDLKAAEEFCRSCEQLGYKITMVNNEP